MFLVNITRQTKEITALKNISLFLFFLFILPISSTFSQPKITVVENQKVILVPPESTHSFMLTNPLGLFYCGETGLPNTSAYHGLSFLTHEFLEDYLLEFGATILDRSKAEACLYSDSLTRNYSSLQVQEHISISDSLPVMMVRIASQQRFPLFVTPLFSGSSKPTDYIVTWSATDKILYIARKNHLVRNDQYNYPVWIGISTYPAGNYSESGIEAFAGSLTLLEQDILYPGKINLFLEEKAYIFFIIGDSKNDILNLRNLSYKNLNLEIHKKDQQIEGIRKI